MDGGEAHVSNVSWFASTSNITTRTKEQEEEPTEYEQEQELKKENSTHM
jgi:hypothetical protein